MRKYLLLLIVLLSSVEAAYSQDSTMVATVVKIGYIDREAVVSSIEAVKTARQKIVQLQKDYETEFDNMTKKYNQKVKQYLETKNSIPEAVKLARQTEITEMESMMSLYKQRYLADVEARRKEFVAPFYKRVDDAIVTVSKIMNLTIVFNAGQPLYLSPDCVDITPYVDELLQKQSSEGK